MARKKTTAVATTIKPAPKFGAKARKLKRDFLKKRQAERESMALMIPVSTSVATTKRKTTKRKTTKRKSTTSTGVSPVCSRAGRRLKVVRSSSAGRTLSSPTCKTGAKKTTAKKATTTAKKRTSAVKSVISPVTKTATRKTATRKTATRKTAVKKVTAKRSVRRSAAASKLARIKKIVC